jgi:hypothetical protein
VREHPQPQQVRLAALLMILYYLGGSHGNHRPSGVRALIPWLLAIRVPGTMVLIMASADPGKDIQCSIPHVRA